MRRTFIWDKAARGGKGDFIPADQYVRPRNASRASLPMPYIQSDYAAYASPLGDGVIEGRAAKREHHKRTGTRPVDPSEWHGQYSNEAFARKRGAHATIDPEPQAKRLPTVIDENWSE
jgi:hypothetical protein